MPETEPPFLMVVDDVFGAHQWGGTALYGRANRAWCGSGTSWNSSACARPAGSRSAASWSPAGRSPRPGPAGVNAVLALARPVVCAAGTDFALVAAGAGPGVAAGAPRPAGTGRVTGVLD
ncbi:hypothetical protein ACIRS1_05670 [Kitasatospora sp. NPDC101176]|uniref:hypothetical protein n=1 Tax=Kitasatospora sp. NPDC101176 TaxID=3364099 RepID=UPI00381BFE1B